MCMHHELSYTLEVPSLMMFACLGAEHGGATGVADAAAVLDALPRGLVERFEREGWVLARNYNDEIGASFADAFGTDDRAPSRRTAGRTRSTTVAARRRDCAPGSAAAPW